MSEPKSEFLKSVLGETKNIQSSQSEQTHTSESPTSPSFKESLAQSVADKLVNEVKTSASNSVTSLAKTTKDNLQTSRHSLLNHAKSANLKIAVVGHTNTGKTSLLRTLLRTTDFGEVKNASATTKHVQKISIFDGETPLVDLFDTPGLEDASGLLDWLDENTNQRADGVERLHTFLADTISENEFNQEAKVIRQLLASDVALYVIDSREPVLGKYKDELTVLSWCAKPVMPVFNFIHLATDTQFSSWQQMLSRRNLHVSASFDTVAFDFDGEIQLWRHLITLLSHTTLHNPSLCNTLKDLINIRSEAWHHLYETAQIEIAHTLLNIAAYHREIKAEVDPEDTLSEMQAQVRQLERRLHSELMTIYQFYNDSVLTTPLNLENFQRDPFDPELLKSYGLRTTSGAVAGAVAGLSIDAATFGASLGLGAAIGGLIGGVLSNTQSISNKIMGTQNLYIDPATITLIGIRAVDLLATLRRRGHADQSKIELQTPAHVTKNTLWESTKLPKALKKARSKPEWSELNTQKMEQSRTLRDEAAWELAHALSITG